MRRGRVLLGMASLAATAVAGCGPGSGPNFIRVVNDSGREVQVREITQSNSPGCYQLGYTNHRALILLSPNGECVLTAGELAPGQLVPISLGTPQSPSVLPPILVVNGDGRQRCVVLPLPVSHLYGAVYDVSELQPGGCD